MELKATDIEEKAEQLYDYIMRFIKDNRKYNEIVQFLKEDGMDEVTAKAVIANVLIIEKKKAKEQMKNGAILASVGLVLTVLTYIVAPYNHNIYIVAYGPVIGGVIMMLRGYTKSK